MTVHSLAETSVLGWRANGAGADARPRAKEAQILENSRSLSWDGISAERYRATDWQIEDLSVRDHLLSCALTDHCIVERSSLGKTKLIALPRNTLTFTAADQTFSSRIPGSHTWGIIALSPQRLREIVGCESVTWHSEFGVADDTLFALVSATMAEVRAGGVSGPLFAEGLTIALASQLARRFGNCPPVNLVPRGLRASQLRKVTEYIQDNLASSLTIKDIAGLVGLSPSHFTRCFKQATGRTPMTHIIRLRVLKAQTLISAGKPLGTVAADCGFSDQAHMTVVFRKVLNVTPGACARWRRSTSALPPKSVQTGNMDVE